jgi:hypothetical protein
VNAAPQQAVSAEGKWIPIQVGGFIQDLESRFAIYNDSVFGSAEL